MTDRSKTALVTGANRGIGLAIAKGLAGLDGIAVLAAARTAKDAEAAAAEVGGGAAGVALDLSDPRAARTEAAAIEQAHGPIDILVNNAGVLIPGDGLEIGLADLEQTLAVNTVAPYALIEVLGAGMKARGWGRVVNVSSGWGAFAEGLGGPASYSISKAALNAVTVTFARALGDAVKVNSACPGWVRTRMGGDAATRSVEQGADTPVWLATLPDDGPTGGFFRDRKAIAW